jgi:hypothetical protein
LGFMTVVYSSMISSSPQTPKGGLKKKIKNLLKPVTKKK